MRDKRSTKLYATSAFLLMALALPHARLLVCPVDDAGQASPGDAVSQMARGSHGHSHTDCHELTVCCTAPVAPTLTDGAGASVLPSHGYEPGAPDGMHDALLEPPIPPPPRI